ncbi:DNA (cytosine-5)-methyltransferase 1, partial [Lecanoromycetidae sp. Uapishka_2]
MDEIATTSSSEEGSQSSLESETFQSAQRPQEVENREQEELFAENDELSDTSSADEKACPEPLNKEDQLSLANSGDKAQLSAIDDEAPVAPDDGLSPSPQLPTRPNRYRGSASTWRNWTAPERDLAASLDQLRAKDLSIHLYNAFKLKQKASTLSAQQGSTDEGTAVEEAWAPPKVWTAWPLPPKYVPREDDERQWEDKEASSKPKPMKPRMPGETLRELLVAQVLRKAKERFAAREWEEEDDDDDDGKESTGLRPVILADDEQAMEILRPSIQHVLKNIDTVLMGLHIARSACLPINEDTDESDLQGQERKSISKSRGRKRRRDASTDNTEYPKSSSRRSTSESDEVVSGAASSATSHKKRPGSYSRNSSRTFHKHDVTDNESDGTLLDDEDEDQDHFTELTLEDNHYQVLYESVIDPDLEQIPDYHSKFDGWTLRPGKTVELCDGEFLRVTLIYQHRITTEIVLQGVRFRRNTYLRGMVERKLNEVTMMLVYDQNVPRDMLAQSTVTVGLHEIRKIRELIKTNQPFPALSFRLTDPEIIKMGGKDYAMAHGRLVCRPNDAALDGIVDLTTRPDSRRRYTFGDAFCGGGGASRGAKGAGLRVEWGFDFNRAAIDTCVLNFWQACYENIAAHEFATIITEDFMVDILHLSPPCQTFSPIHVHQGKDDEMNEATFFAVEEIIRKTKPRIVTLEETFGLTRTPEKLTWFHALIQVFTKLGFSVRWKVFDLRVFGLAQPRKRLFVMASCVNDAIGNIPRGFSLHDPEQVMKRDELPYNGDIPLKNTITTQGVMCYHPSGKRNFTTRELACLQGFPFEHRFCPRGTRKQIGNAVPPLVAKVFFEHIKLALQEEDGLR